MPLYGIPPTAIVAVSQLATTNRLCTMVIRSKKQAKEQADKATPKTYSRHYNCYETWWNTFEAAKILRNRQLVALPAMPIIAAKVVMFLQYETTREKKKRGSTETIAGSSVGKSQVSQVISALEQFRHDSQHLYKDCPEAQIPLRHDQRIRQFESASKKDEPKRAEPSRKGTDHEGGGEFLGQAFDFLFYATPADKLAQIPIPLTSFASAHTGVYPISPVPNVFTLVCVIAPCF
ncbi:hypothetical protein DFH07DRAFT_771599 [Mycena maculata]|uniref:Uncharacterized protein n=1 Tax=Mycena maculata TaxID=230809 RepID=A0AAD7NGF6_9AGAR|nr:hypothetical protein DFH07DRAFT_771599 [Mycena maculata]